jgi:uncharacterized Zn-binding protein involved in type VI secretion
MKTKAAWFAAMWLFPLPVVAQAPAVPTMDQEPHHHLALQNDYVKVFDVHVSPGDSIVLHRHDQDTVAIAIGDQLVTVGIPGKPDVHQKNEDAQLRLQRSGYVHSTRVDGDTPYHTVAVELLHPQTNFHNVCSAILPGQPLNCQGTPAFDSSFWLAPSGPAVYFSQPLLESNETHVRLVRVPPHQSIDITYIPNMQSVSRLIVALDPVLVTSNPSKKPAETLQPGEFKWFNVGQHAEGEFQSSGDKDARLLDIILQAGPN